LRFSPRAGDATISKKSHHQRKQKIARVAAALGSILQGNSAQKSSIQENEADYPGHQKVTLKLPPVSKSTMNFENFDS